MKTTIIIKYKDNSALVKEEYTTKAIANNRFTELIKMGHEKEIKCFWIGPTNKPEERTRIDF